MTDDIRFAASPYPKGRQCLLCGEIAVGAVFPPAYDTGKWMWRIWLNGRNTPSEGEAKTEDAAKSAALRAFNTFLAAANLTTKTEASP